MPFYTAKQNEAETYGPYHDDGAASVSCQSIRSDDVLRLVQHGCGSKLAVSRPPHV